jgi:hypothetical protein
LRWADPRPRSPTDSVKLKFQNISSEGAQVRQANPSRKEEEQEGQDEDEKCLCKRNLITDITAKATGSKSLCYLRLDAIMLSFCS